ncbi:hypothetical protein Glove_203g38 [Diversispora epigaea]|uniref:Uncharacterized protein n=1 Tax=Diversispora epigaea TaxID=1348612 RepID=A0A397IJM7_9GLOM|nr:hypothetical protein Glove_203g38 [Diversispora epigaea]
MFCIHPAELVTLCITDVKVTGYTKNRDQKDIPQKFVSLEKNQERVKELFTEYKMLYLLVEWVTRSSLWCDGI